MLNYRLKKQFPLAALLSLGMTLSACDSNSSANLTDDGESEQPDTTEQPAILTGVFDDSRVIGLDYKTLTQTGHTNASGEFTYLAGETVTFSLGAIPLGSVVGKERVTTFDIGDSLTKDSVTDEYNDLHLATLLQSLDDNQNPADGFIDLSSISPSLTTGVSIENGVTQAILDTITGEAGKAKLVLPQDAANHATISANSAITEENGSLTLTSAFSQEDIDADIYRVTTRFGHSFNISEFTADNPLAYIESDVKVSSNTTVNQARARLRMNIEASDEIFYIGFGIMYKNGDYSVNYFIERADPATGEIVDSIPGNELDGFVNVSIEKGQSYKLRLEYDVTEQMIFSYVDGVKVNSWDFGDGEGVDLALNGSVDNETNMYLENRADAAIDETTGKPGPVDTSFVVTFDNLVVHSDGDVLLEDDFNDSIQGNANVNISGRGVKTIQ